MKCVFDCSDKDFGRKKKDNLKNNIKPIRIKSTRPHGYNMLCGKNIPTKKSTHTGTRRSFCLSSVITCYIIR